MMREKTRNILFILSVILGILVLGGLINTLFNYTGVGYYASMAEGDSMEPTLQNGDVLIYGPYSELEEGDVVRFRPEGENKIIVHRIIDVDHNRDRPYKLKGDNNSIPDGWFSEEEIKSQVEHQVLNLEPIVPVARNIPFPR